MGAFIRLYTFLSQIFDYGNTAIEKRAIFYKRLLPLLEFGVGLRGLERLAVIFAAVFSAVFFIAIIIGLCGRHCYAHRQQSGGKHPEIFLLMNRHGRLLIF